MAYDRYSFLDPYILEELSREYKSRSTRDRIRLLKKLGKGERLIPYEIALLAIEDPDSTVRAWFAKNAKDFDYRERDYSKKESVYRYPDRDLEERLLSDNDSYVRACVYENPCLFGLLDMGGHSGRVFQASEHLQRLALMRNPKLGNELVEKLYDLDDKTLGISQEDRKELLFAFLSNTEVYKESHKEYFDFHDGWAAYSTTKHYKTIWELAAKWPPESGVPYATFRSVGAEDETKAIVYSASHPVIKRAILENCSDKDTKTLSLGITDPDDICRVMAYELYRPLSKPLEDIVAGNDTLALSGLARNERLSLEDLTRVRSRLRELDDDIGADSAMRTIKNLEKRYPPKNPQELFGYEGRRGEFLEDKIDYIGNKLMGLQENIDNELAQQDPKGDMGQVMTFLKRIFG